MNRINMLLIGLGPHAKRIYFPLLEECHNKLGINLSGLIDLESQRDKTEDYLRDKTNQPKLLFVTEEEMSYDVLHPNVERQLNQLVKSEAISAVIIATEPLTHVMYAKWALKSNLSILMDKPVSTYQNVSTTSPLAARMLLDYEILQTLYEKAILANPAICFSMMAQRRYQTSFKIIRNLISECFAKTNCPVTNIQTFHSDGQWRMPSEMVDQLYHPYMQGYGVCSHSGYHYFDIIPFLMEAGLNPEREINNVDIFSNFVRPKDLLEQFSFDDYESLFGPDNWLKTNKYSRAEFDSLSGNFGEVDSFSNLLFKHNYKAITVASINLCHNGFSDRHWITAHGKDLYHGNGRVGHETHILQQGPFQTIHFHSYKSKNNTNRPRDVGGKEHLELYVFRNARMIGGDPVEIITLDDILEREGSPLGIAGKAKGKAFLDFIAALQGKKTRSEVVSEFQNAKAAVTIASGIYQSAAARMTGENPLINLPFSLNPNLVTLPTFCATEPNRSLN